MFEVAGSGGAARVVVVGVDVGGDDVVRMCAGPIGIACGGDGRSRWFDGRPFVSPTADGRSCC